MHFFFRTLDINFRLLERAYWNLTYHSYEQIVKTTGCRRPCIYHQYKLIGKKIPIGSYKGYIYSLWSPAPSVEVARETDIYSLDSLVADFGGVLSLFLGVSFMTLWHLLMAMMPRLCASLLACFDRIRRFDSVYTCLILCQELFT